jgi:integrase/recombinase XerD
LRLVQHMRFHDMRHRHAVDWLKKGKSIYDLQQRLGHTSVKTTEIYLAYLTPVEKRAVMFTDSEKAQNQAHGQRFKQEQKAKKSS